MIRGNGEREKYLGEIEGKEERMVGWSGKLGFTEDSSFNYDRVTEHGGEEQNEE